MTAGNRRWPDSVYSQLRPECILEIKPTGRTTGEIVWRWHAWDHLIQDFDESKANFGDVSKHPERIDVNFGSGMMDRLMQDPAELRKLRSLGYVGGVDDDEPSQDQRGGSGGGPMQSDWTHVNFVAYNPKLDQIMLSVHEFSEVWVLDHSTTTAEAASHKDGRSGKGGDLLYRWGNPRAYRGGSDTDQSLFAQHCAHWIEDGLPGAGNMLVFNNGGGRPDGQYSSVDEIDMPVDARGMYDKKQDSPFPPKQAAWTYTAPDKSHFFSMLMSGAQRLPNGNTLVCSGNQALLFEVTPRGEIVWRYKHPGGGFGGLGGMPRPGELLPEFLQRVLAVTDSQKELIRKLQADVDAKLAQLLTNDQRKKLEEPMRFPFGGPGDPDRRRPAQGAGDATKPRRPGRDGFRPPRVGEVIPQFLTEELALSEAQRTALEQLQQHVDDELVRTWTTEQKKQLKEMQGSFAAGPGAGPPHGFGPTPGFGPPGFGPDGDERRGDSKERGGPGGGPGAPGGGPGGVFCSFRYAPDFPGLAGRELPPRRKLAEVAATTRPSDN